MEIKDKYSGVKVGDLVADGRQHCVMHNGHYYAVIENKYSKFVHIYGGRSIFVLMNLKTHCLIGIDSNTLVHPVEAEVTINEC